jgi:hypothetical protein
MALIGTGIRGVPAVRRGGRHRGSSPFFEAGRHRAPTSGSRRARRDTVRPAITAAPRRHPLPAGVAALVVVLTGATVLSGWFAASGAAALAGMIAH